MNNPNQSDTFRWRNIAFTFIFLFTISIIIAGFQFASSERFKDLLNESERTIIVLSEQLDASQSQITGYATQLDYYRQLANQYQNEVQSLQERLVTEKSIGRMLSSDNLIIQMESPSVRVGDNFSFEGVSTTFTIEIRAGNGDIFVNTEPLVGFDIQSSARLAARVAENFTGVDLFDRDIIISVKAPVEVEGVDGPSAGATMTVMMIAAIEGVNIRPNVMITGTIEPGGRIGPVSGILEKAEAAFNAGKTVFLIPQGLTKQTIFRMVDREIVPGFTIAVPQPVEIDIREVAAERWNLAIIEVATVAEALEHAVIE